MQLVTRQLSQIVTQPVSWLWPGRVPRGKVTMLAGDPGLGKSFVTMDLAARVTVGAAMPDGSYSTPRTPGTVLVLSAEDDAADTIRPRIEKAGGDPSRVLVVDGVRRADGATLECGEGVRLDINMPAVEAQLASMDRPMLVIIDPISAYLGEKDGNSNAHIRALLAELARLAAAYGPAIVCVSHLNKNGTGKAVYRMIGSLAFTAAARIAWQVSVDPEDSSRRLLLLLKSNLDAVQTGLSFEVKDGRVEWSDTPVAMTASSLEDGATAAGLGVRGNGPRPGEPEAVTFLRDLLRPAPRPAVEALRLATEAGLSRISVKRAKQTLGITSRRVSQPGGGGQWVWALSTANSAGNDPGPTAEPANEDDQIPFPD